MAQEMRTEVPEGAKTVPDEAQQAFDEKQKELNRKILERAASDADFRSQLVDNPQQALDSAGLGQELAELMEPSKSSEVSGHWYSDWWRVCTNYSYYVGYYHEG